jgi:hypothetical protein
MNMLLSGFAQADADDARLIRPVTQAAQNRNGLLDFIGGQWLQWVSAWDLGGNGGGGSYLILNFIHLNT